MSALTRPLPHLSRLSLSVQCVDRNYCVTVSTCHAGIRAAACRSVTATDVGTMIVPKPDVRIISATLRRIIEPPLLVADDT